MKNEGGDLIISIQGQLKTALMHSNYKTSVSTSNNGAITGTVALKSKENILNCSNDGFLNFKPCKKVCSDSSEEYAVSTFRMKEFGSDDCCSISIHLNQIQSPPYMEATCFLEVCKKHTTHCAHS
jgi:hypothetical protein